MGNISWAPVFPLVKQAYSLAADARCSSGSLVAAVNGNPFERWIMPGCQVRDYQSGQEIHLTPLLQQQLERGITNGYPVSMERKAINLNQE
jgi:hypothetical protein